MSNSLEDPLARFRSSMGASTTSMDHPPLRFSPDPEGGSRGGGGRQGHSASMGGGPTTSTSAEDGEEDGAQLLRLIDEATHAIGHDDESPARGDMSAAGASFIVTASASQTSFTIPPPPQYAPTTGATPSLNASHAMLPPPSPPTFAETMANPNRGTPVLAGAVAGPSAGGAQYPLSPPPFGMISASVQQTSAPPPPPHASGGGPAENMVVRNLRGVFLLQPIGKSGNNGSSHQGTQPSTPSYAPPQYTASCPGASPPVSPLPSYALPPPLPAMQYLGGTVQGSSGVLNQQHHGTPQQKNSAGQSPPYYPAPPPPYRSPVGKGGA